MKIGTNIDYRGSSKILNRLCQAVNYILQHSTGEPITPEEIDEACGFINVDEQTNEVHEN